MKWQQLSRNSKISTILSLGVVPVYGLLRPTIGRAGTEWLGLEVFIVGALLLTSFFFLYEDLPARDRKPVHVLMLLIIASVVILRFQLY